MRFDWPLLGLAPLSVLTAVACSSAAGPAPETTPSVAAPSEVGVPDAGGPATEADAAPVRPPFVPTFPVVVNAGGPVIKSPRIQPIVFKGDALAGDIEKLMSALTTSTFLPDVGKEYGVGAMTAAAPIVIDAPPPSALTSEEIEAWLTERLTAASSGGDAGAGGDGGAGATPAFGVPDESTLYAVFYPPGVTITMDLGGSGGESCHGFGGYHYEVAAGGKHVGYAVLPRCSDMAELSLSTSHEIFEWATDPFPLTKPAYAVIDDAHWAFQPLTYGELGDLCTFLDQEPIVPADLGFTVQRMFSNEASKKGVFPCVPNDGKRAFFAAIPHAEDTVQAMDYRSRESLDFVETKAVRLPRGTTRTVDVSVYASTPTTGITVSGMTLDQLYQRPSTSGFELSLSSHSASSGDTLKLEVTAPKKAATDIVVLYARKDESIYMWPVVVTTEDQVFPPGVSGTFTPRLRAARSSLRPVHRLPQ